MSKIKIKSCTRCVPEVEIQSPGITSLIMPVSKPFPLLLSITAFHSKYGFIIITLSHAKISTDLNDNLGQTCFHKHKAAAAVAAK